MVRRTLRPRPRHLCPAFSLKASALCASPAVCENQLQISSLPSSLTVLQLPYRYNQLLLPGVLPDSLLQLTLSHLHLHSLQPGVFPASLERLCLRGWSQPLTAHMWPPRLKALRLDKLDQPLQAGLLPASLLYLSFGSHVRQPLLPGFLPHGLVELRLGSHHPHILAPNIFPSPPPRSHPRRLFPPSPASGFTAGGAAVPPLPDRCAVEEGEAAKAGCFAARRVAFHTAGPRPQQPFIKERFPLASSRPRCTGCACCAGTAMRASSWWCRLRLR